MAKIANVALTNTFDTWRIRTNQAFHRLSQFTINESSLYSNTLIANVRFISLGPTKLGASSLDTTITNGLLQANGRVRISSNLRVAGNTVFGDTAASQVEFTANTVSISTTLSIDSGTLFINPTTNRIGVGKTNPNTTFDVAGIIRSSTGGFRFPDGGTATAPLYVYDSSGSQVYP
jgi:hypothetical protein